MSASACLQGREKDVVIFSCVRTAGVHYRSIGFVADERRINVGITRARCALLIIGHASSLAVDERWRNLVKSAVDRNAMFQPTKPYNDYMQQVRRHGREADGVLRLSAHKATSEAVTTALRCVANSNRAHNANSRLA